MEEDLHTYAGASAYAGEKTMERINERLDGAVEKAQERIDYESAHNEEILKALDVIASFIRRRKRVCYGGTAMNAILPDSMKFYDPEHDLPDYDFYTPDAASDVAEIVADLKAAGFKDVHHKVGIHEGTKKILVDFMPVADISSIDKNLFNILYKRSILKDGIHYTDPDILRMMMYLELSRPRGMVSRWKKVFERLELVNRAFPIKGCGGGNPRLHPLSPPVHNAIIDFVIEHQRILCSGPLKHMYTKGIHGGSVKFDVHRTGPPVVFVSPDPRADAVALKRRLEGSKDVRLFLHRARGDIVPLRAEIQVGNRPVCLIVHEVACHSANAVPTSDKRHIQIASPELIITLYLSLAIFTQHSADVLGHRILCHVKDMIDTAHKNHKAGRSSFPPFALTCKGHQTRFASLLREKIKRVQKEREAMEGSLVVSQTRKRKEKKRRSSRKDKKGSE
jgi:hypothetical protein